METDERVTFKTTGATGIAISTATRTGLGDLDGLWYQVRWNDGETTWVHSTSVQTDTQASERAQVEEVFRLTGGELMDAPWNPHYRIGGSALFNTALWAAFPFTYWYQGIPDYVTPLETAWWTPGDYRTVCESELYLGRVPETVTDEQGTWKVVARYPNSGECECPWLQNDDAETNRAPCKVTEDRAVNGKCNLCGASVGEEHGYIYIGDGWAEIVYRLQEPPEVHGELAVQEHVSERGQRYVDTGVPETTFTIDEDRDERARALRLSCEAGHLAVTLPRYLVQPSHEVASFYLRVWEVLYAADTGQASFS